MNLKEQIREIKDYPKEGIDFKDISTLLKNPAAFRNAVDQIIAHYKSSGITKVVSLESRGFIVGGAVAYQLGAGFVPVRKSGKLPYKVVSETYELEYGTDCVEMHIDAIESNDVVLIHDDLLATGGTALASLNLVKQFSPKTIFFSFLIDLSFICTPNKRILQTYPTHTIIQY